MYLRKNVQWTGEMCTSLRRATLGHCVGSGGGGAAVGSRGRGLPYHSTERAWRSVRRHCGSSPSAAAHKLNLLCTWWKLFPHFCRMRKLLLLIIFPLNAVGSIFSPALLLFSYLDPITTTDKETDKFWVISKSWPHQDLLSRNVLGLAMIMFPSQRQYHLICDWQMVWIYWPG